MRRAVSVMLCAAALLAPATASAETRRTRASIEIEQQAGVDLDGAVALRAVQHSPGGGAGPASVLAATSPTPANLLVTGGAADAISISVPELLDLDREGGLETLQLRLNGEGAAEGSTLLSSSGGVSVRLAGGVEAPVNPVVPGDYRGLLVIVAQWN